MTTNTGAGANPFDTLLDELDVMTKAMKPDDTTAAAAADSGVQDTGGDEGEGGEGGGEGDDDGDEVFGKSFKVKLADGTETEAFDGTEMMKALNARIGTVGADMLKGMGAITALLKKQGETIVAQGALIKSLQGELGKLGNQGRGRNTTVVLNGGGQGGGANNNGGSKPEPMGREAILAKALSLATAGKLMSTDVARVESYLNSGLQLPPDLARVIAA